ncbi:hypothetical protein EZV62_023411 [Acer yangbiense]|uniref:RING-type E3 ubiquitin transferase n=1 Tax=Acer yangbiense TaxID=1000413 RepID=A0A5C7H212_9ROSI|nr:hypothetical protein EZV62_023411 [Acer yangbiense]
MWDGFFFCLGGAVLYVCGTSFDRDIDLVKMAKRVNKLKDLAQLFNTESKFSPLVVISGRVGSETPIICDYSPLGGVIVEKTTKLWFKKLNDVGSWIKDSSLLESIHKVVPWYLDDGTGRAFVVGAQNSLGPVLIAKKEVFDGSVGSCLNEKLGFPTGIKVLGVEHVERLLPIGASMTDWPGRLTVDELLADMGMSSRLDTTKAYNDVRIMQLRFI